MAVRRYDVGTLEPPKELSGGRLRADGYPTRAGIFVYRNPDGTERRELRTPEEVFSADSLETLKAAPVTDDHPPALLTAENAKEYARGTVGEDVRRDGDHVRSRVTVFDAELIAKMRQGKRQLSCGYDCDLDRTPGEWNGQRYDAVQKNIVYNHLAIVEVGRAGPSASVRMDAADAVMVGAIEACEERADSQQGGSMKVRIDGVEYDVTEQVAQALDKERAEGKAKLEESAKLASGEKARADKAEATLEEAKKALEKEQAARKDAEDPAKVREQIKARVALESEARKHLGDEVKLDELDEQAIKLAVLGKLSPEFKAEGKSAEYVQARFDAAIERVARENPHLDAARAAISASAGEKSSADAHREMVERNRNAWKQAGN